MNAKTALCRALLEGRVLNVGNCFREIGLTNISRELPRMIEGPFGVEVSRTSRVGKNRYGSPVSYTNYHLNKTDYNKAGMEAMAVYVNENCGVDPIKKPVGRPAKKVAPIEPPTIHKQSQQKLF